MVQGFIRLTRIRSLTSRVGGTFEVDSIATANDIVRVLALVAEWIAFNL